MSFFIKGQKKQKQGQKHKLNNKKNEKPNFHNGEILSSDEEYENTNQSVPDYYNSDDENETTQEKKLRLAKMYLEEIENEERQRLEENDAKEDENNDIISKRLKHDYLKQIGKLKLSVASKYQGADISNIKILKCKLHKRSVTCLCLSNDTKFIFSGSKDGVIIKWSVSELKKIATTPFIKKSKKNTTTENVMGHRSGIVSLRISSDDIFLAASDEDKNIHIWNFDLSHLGLLKGHRDMVTGLVFRYNTHTLYSCSKDRTVKVWSLDEMSYVETAYGHQDNITSIDALTRERAITSGSGDRSVRIWKFGDDSQLIYNGHSGSIDVVRLINEEHFVTGGDDGEICVWSVMKKKPLCTVKQAHGCNPVNLQPYWITSLASLLNTDLIASGSCNKTIKLWSLEEHFRKINLLFEIPVVGFINDLSFTKDEKHLIVAVGTEHKFGRWEVINNAKNSVLIIPLLCL